MSRRILRFNRGNPENILIYNAPKPLGTWSMKPVWFLILIRWRLYPCSGVGYGRFLNIPANIKKYAIIPGITCTTQDSIATTNGV
ncbi:MAG TPA: hypothetical protein VN704_10685 [Verrucomicrobiae bacterium]|nr:hypothetical protein [Verrucomicrobiae bacterium]